MVWFLGGRSMKLIIVTGLSGSGKSVAIKQLEDPFFGYEG